MIQPNLGFFDYKMLVEQAPILIWRARTDGLCDYFNDRWLSFRGRTMEEEFGNGWAEGVHPDDFDRCLEFYLDNFKKRQIFEMEYRLKRFDGDYRWIFDRGVPVFHSDGNFAGFIGSCIDITERVEAQIALKAAQESEINQLKGLLPICMYCKKIRNDQGYWSQVEVYIRDHSMATFSHGICPSCMTEKFPDLAE